MRAEKVSGSSALSADAGLRVFGFLVLLKAINDSASRIASLNFAVSFASSSSEVSPSPVRSIVTFFDTGPTESEGLEVDPRRFLEGIVWSQDD